MIRGIARDEHLEVLHEEIEETDEVIRANHPQKTLIDMCLVRVVAVADDPARDGSDHHEEKEHPEHDLRRLLLSLTPRWTTIGVVVS